MNNSLFLLRKSLSSNTRVTLASLTQQALLLLNPTNHQQQASFIRNFYPINGQIAGAKAPIASLFRRDFHGVAGALSFRASSGITQAAGFAVADVADKGGGRSDDETLEISKLGVAPEIVAALEKKGISKLFPIQRAVLEPAMQGRDMIGRARTGTGKTLAFGIPIMDKITRFNAKHGRGRNPLAICLAPTRELARQVEKEFYESAPHLDTLCCYGGAPISRQMSILDRGVDVVVGTPGRVIDLIKRGALNLSEIQFVVLDEADQMLNVGFADDVETILESIPQEHQTMMFSATMPTWIRQLTQKFLKNPQSIDLVGESDQKLAEGITLYSITSETYERAAIIGPLVTEHAKGGKCIVFTQTKRDADRLAYALKRSFPCQPLHGDISQNERERTLSGFRNGEFNILVATDVAARGLDVPNVDLVIHYELPNSSEIFVHRSGRTGRAGKKGSAILIYTSSQFRDVKGIERDVGCKFAELPRIVVEGGAGDMFRDMGGSGRRFGSFGSMGSGRFGNSGRSGSYGGSSRTGGFGGSSGGFGGSSGGCGGSEGGRFGGPSGRSGGYGGSEVGRFGGSSSGRFGGSYSGRFGGDGDSSYGRTSGFGGSSGQSGGFGGPSSGRSSGFGSQGGSYHSSAFGEFGSGQASGFGNFQSGKDTLSSWSSGFGNDKADADGSPGKKYF